MIRRLMLIALVLVGAEPGFAQTANTSAPVVAPAPLPDEKTLSITDNPSPATNGVAGTPSTDITVWDFVKMFVILALVIGMILGFLWFLRKLSGQGAVEDSPIQVLHSHTLGGSKSLQVVEIGDTILLLGASDSGVQLIKDLTGSEAADAFRLSASQKKAAGKGRGFADLLGTLMGSKPKIRPDLTQPGDNSSDFLKKQRERLKKL